MSIPGITDDILYNAAGVLQKSNGDKLITDKRVESQIDELKQRLLHARLAWHRPEHHWQCSAPYKCTYLLTYLQLMSGEGIFQHMRAHDEHFEQLF